MIERRIDDISLFGDLGNFNDINNQKETEKRICPIHNESVSRRSEISSELPDIRSVLSPFPSVIFSGCCDNAIDKEIEFIKLTVSNHHKNNPPQIIGL